MSHRRADQYPEKRGFRQVVQLGQDDDSAKNFRDDKRGLREGFVLIAIHGGSVASTAGQAGDAIDMDVSLGIAVAGGTDLSHRQRHTAACRRVACPSATGAPRWPIVLLLWAVAPDPIAAQTGSMLASDSDGSQE
ncbi:hypothetical protein GCM10009006_34700 [Haloarcula argentinensis]|uniref:Uncharacterized protein n=1 Tax=Haloarcula argentinensis TaxID=43776 RepID=A0A830FIL9_HALAR|nr:hypothetical protein GCM10009006_34700 [Haloarcula argentinensis]